MIAPLFMTVCLEVVRDKREERDREKSGTGETDDGSRFEVRGFRNLEPSTSNFVSRLSRTACLSRSRLTIDISQ
jgi:hypothetical protein